jgi:integrase/recombinase XerD
VGFSKYKYAEGLTKRSVESYEHILNQWVKRRGDKDIAEVKKKDLRAYLAWLRTEYQPVRFNGKIHPLSPKTIRNIWVALSAFYKWASFEFEISNPMKDIPAPKFKQAPVDAFTRIEVERLLKACNFTRDADTKYRRSYSYKRPTSKRDRAIILTLLDTGLRAMELCSLRTQSVN